MNIEQFVEESERQFDEFCSLDKTVMCDSYWHVRCLDARFFTSSKLRELIGEVRKIVEKQMYDEKPEPPLGKDSDFHDGWFRGLDSVLQLLDEAGGG